MSTLTVELPDELATRLAGESTRRRVPPAEFVKILLETHLPAEKSEEQKRAALNAFLREWSGAGGSVMTDEEIKVGYLAHQLSKHSK